MYEQVLYNSRVIMLRYYKCWYEQNLNWNRGKQDLPAPPICGCLVIIIDCNAIKNEDVIFDVLLAELPDLPTGSLWKRRSRTRPFRRSFFNVISLKTGSNSCRARNVRPSDFRT